MSESRRQSSPIAGALDLIEAEADAAETSDPTPRDYRAWRQANVYDAVAGRLTTTTKSSRTAIQDHPRPGVDRAPRLRKATVHSSTLAPEEALFRRGLAPERYAEHDVYMAHERRLPDGTASALPDSDLVKAVHTYSAHYYSAHSRTVASAQPVGNRPIDETSMDETALLAFGILLEEAGRALVGKQGDLILTEGLELQAEPRAERPGQVQLDHSLQSTVSFQTMGSSRQRKRRKMTDFNDD
ncbi:hypothetical protein HYQ45_000745 [Verticillium longisporum]|uniref:Uncharacterized protein n=1 Tax=Verticillium longisporum TaxID=100787 RepID=A0A8I3A3U0_VERLO|nr:hypothetical protein HYQ45_000745 [Verticillium longisporum]